MFVFFFVQIGGNEILRFERVFQAILKSQQRASSLYVKSTDIWKRHKVYLRFGMPLVWLRDGAVWPINRWIWRQQVCEPPARGGFDCDDWHISIIKRIIKLIEIYIADITSRSGAIKENRAEEDKQATSKTTRQARTKYQKKKTIWV